MVDKWPARAGRSPAITAAGRLLLRAGEAGVRRRGGHGGLQLEGEEGLQVVRPARRRRRRRRRRRPICARAASVADVREEWKGGGGVWRPSRLADPY